MQLKSLLMLIILIASIVAPFKIHISTSQNFKKTIIVTLDVCHASDASLSVNTDSPSLHECPCKPPLLQFEGFCESSEPFMVTFLISFQEERPPKA